MHRPKGTMPSWIHVWTLPLTWSPLAVYDFAVAPMVVPAFTLLPALILVLCPHPFGNYIKCPVMTP
jgi:hypothetical protein